MMNHSLLHGIINGGSVGGAAVSLSHQSSSSSASSSLALVRRYPIGRVHDLCLCRRGLADRVTLLEYLTQSLYTGCYDFF